MKLISLFTIFVGLISATAQENPVSAKTPNAPAQELMQNQKDFLNLSEETRREFLKHLAEANRLFQQKRIFETLERLEKAQGLFKDSPEVYNLRGSCFVEMRSFDRAIEDFNKALELSKNNPSIMFNVAEVYFVTKEWQKAVDIFQVLLKDIPAQNVALSRLIEFKILLCKNKLGKKDEVLILSEKYDFLDDSPYYYYSKAALEYEANNLVKAEEWLAMASRIFRDPNLLAPWQDTLIEYGYIKSFYGNETEVEDQ